MKIRVSKHSKYAITLAEIPQMKKIIKDFKEDNGLQFYAETAVKIVCPCPYGNYKIIKAEAEIIKQNKAFNVLDNESGWLDVELNIWAFHEDFGFFIIQCSITDVWKYDGYNAEELKTEINNYEENYTYSEIIEMQTELENLKQLKPFEDIESFHNYLDTSIYFVDNLEIYNQYCEEELKTFTENTGFEITG